MSGAYTPKQITTAFGEDAVPPYVTDPVPVPSQIGTDNGRASYTDGFVPLNFTPPSAGGIPPFGSDMNGILLAVSSWCKALQMGLLTIYSSTVSGIIGGYPRGALLRSGIKFFTSFADDNTNNPNVDASTWISSEPLYATAAPAAGTVDDYVLPGPSDYVLDIDTTAGNVDFTGFIRQRDGQKLHITNTGANLLQILALNTGSGVNNRVRIPTDFAIVQNQTVTLQYSDGALKWLAT